MVVAGEEEDKGSELVRAARFRWSLSRGMAPATRQRRLVAWLERRGHRLGLARRIIDGLVAEDAEAQELDAAAEGEAEEKAEAEAQVHRYTMGRQSRGAEHKNEDEEGYTQVKRCSTGRQSKEEESEENEDEEEEEEEGEGAEEAAGAELIRGARQRWSLSRGLAPETRQRRLVAWLARRGHPIAVAKRIIDDLEGVDRARRWAEEQVAEEEEEEEEEEEGGE